MTSTMKMETYSGTLETIPGAKNIRMTRVIPTQTNQQSNSIPMNGLYSASLDVSGSMYNPATVTNDDGDKINHGWSQLDIGKHSTCAFINGLGPQDWFTASEYSDTTTPIISWTRCDEAGKKLIINKVMQIQPRGATNFVAAINGCLDPFYNLPSEVTSSEYNMVGFITSDGQPSTFFQPVRGDSGYKTLITSAINLHKTAGRHINLYTIGLGTSLNSILMTEMCSGSGAFLHLPDPGCVGPFMVNFLAKQRSIDRLPDTHKPANNMYLKLGPIENIKSVNGYESSLERYNNSLYLPLQSILVDRPRHIVYEVWNLPPNDIKSTLCHKKCDNTFQELEVHVEHLNNPTLVAAHFLRQMSVKAMRSIFNRVVFNPDLVIPIQEVLSLLQTTLDDIISREEAQVSINLGDLVQDEEDVNPRVSDQKSIENLIATLQEEVLQGLTPINFSTWGAHFPRSLAVALFQENRTCFRDKCTQEFAQDFDGQFARFEKESNVAEKCFGELPAPPPSLGMPQHPIARGQQGTSNTTSTLPPEFMRGGGCFGEKCTVNRWNGEDFISTPVTKIKNGDVLQTSQDKATVQCVIKSQCPNSEAELVALISDVNINCWHGEKCIILPELLISPYHPIHFDQWEFPIDKATPTIYNCSHLYNFCTKQGSYSASRWV